MQNSASNIFDSGYWEVVPLYRTQYFITTSTTGNTIKYKYLKVLYEAVDCILTTVTKKASRRGYYNLSTADRQFYRLHLVIVLAGNLVIWRSTSGNFTRPLKALPGRQRAPSLLLFTIPPKGFCVVRQRKN